MNPDWKALEDLVTFARAEVYTGDVEPWADTLREVRKTGTVDDEELAWLMTLYNTYDDINSGWGIYDRWRTPAEWDAAPDKADAADGKLYPRMQERRNLHGLSVLKRHQGYADQLAGGTQLDWYEQPLLGISPGEDFKALTAHMRQIWGVGRLAAFEWAEFVGKVFDLPVDAADGQLWESSGPRESLEKLYGIQTSDVGQLNFIANECKEWLAYNGVPLKWVDFETIVCDFKVMRKGGYFVGRHLTMLKTEILDMTDLDLQMTMLDAFNESVPEEWQGIPTNLGSNYDLRHHYQKTGQVRTTPWWG